MEVSQLFFSYILFFEVKINLSVQENSLLKVSRHSFVVLLDEADDFVERFFLLNILKNLGNEKVEYFIRTVGFVNFENLLF